MGFINNKIKTAINKRRIERGNYDLLFPDDIYLNINGVCNQRCSMCPIGQKKDNDFTNLNNKGENK